MCVCVCVRAHKCNMFIRKKKIENKSNRISLKTQFHVNSDKMDLRTSRISLRIVTTWANCMNCSGTYVHCIAY